MWQKLREVILKDIGQQKPTYQQLKDCNYLKWVLNEGTSPFLSLHTPYSNIQPALRLYPVGTPP